MSSNEERDGDTFFSARETFFAKNVEEYLKPSLAKRVRAQIKFKLIP